MNLFQDLTSNNTPRVENGVESINGSAPFTQRWLYAFYYHYEKHLTETQKSIFNNLLETMDSEDQHIKDCEASAKLKSSVAGIVKRTIERARDSHKTISKQSIKAKAKLHL